MQDNNAPFGSTIVLLGTAADGPLLEPVNVVSPEHALSVFGREGTLYSGYMLAYTTNPQASYYLMRINGSYASWGVELHDLDGNACWFEIKSKDAGTAGNDISVYADENMLAIKDKDNECVYDLCLYKSLGEVVEKINTDAALGYCPVTASVAFPEFPSSVLPQHIDGVIYLSGGTDKLMMTKNELYEALANAYAKLEGFRTDIIVPLGIYFDDIVPVFIYGGDESLYGSAWYSREDDYLNLTIDGKQATFHGQLIDFCRRQTARGLPAHGVLGFRPIPDEISIIKPEHIASLAATTCLNIRYGFKDTEDDYGHYISLVLGDLEYDSGYYQAAPVYAALLSAAGVETTTNMPLVSFTKQKAMPTNDALKLASKYGIVMFYDSIKNGLCVYNGVTAAPSYRPLHYIANVRIGQYLIYMLYLLADNLIGSTQGIIPVRDKVEKAVDELLNGSQKAGIIKSYSFDVTTEYIGEFSFVCNINLRFTPKYSVEELSVSTSVGFS